MKIVKFISILGLCALAVCACKKDDNSFTDTGIVTFNEFGMQAYFPKNTWGYETKKDSTIPGLEEKIEIISAALKESLVTGTKSYSTYTNFIRFVDTFDDESSVDELIDLIKASYDYYIGEGILSVDPLESTTISIYPAVKLSAVKIGNTIEESYFIYHEKRLYWICMIVSEDKINSHYNECKEILNSFKIE